MILVGFPAYEIVWTQTPTYGMRKLVGFGRVVNGNKRFLGLLRLVIPNTCH
jgi:hypothetical protein